MKKRRAIIHHSLKLALFNNIDEAFAFQAGLLLLNRPQWDARVYQPCGDAGTLSEGYKFAVSWEQTGK